MKEKTHFFHILYKKAEMENYERGILDINILGIVKNKRAKNEIRRQIVV